MSAGRVERGVVDVASRPLRRISLHTFIDANRAMARQIANVMSATSGLPRCSSAALNTAPPPVAYIWELSSITVDASLPASSARGDQHNAEASYRNGGHVPQCARDDVAEVLAPHFVARGAQVPSQSRLRPSVSTRNSRTAAWSTSPLPQ